MAKRKKIDPLLSQAVKALIKRRESVGEVVLARSGRNIPHGIGADLGRHLGIGRSHVHLLLSGQNALPEKHRAALQMIVDGVA